MLGLHAEIPVFVYNCSGWRVFHVMNVEEDKAMKLPAETRVIYCRSVTEGEDQG